MVTLKIVQPTVFKSRPVPSNELPTAEKLSVAPRELPVQSATLEGNHYRIQLTQPISNRSEWFAFKDHVQVAALPTLVVKNDTVFKVKLAVSSELAPSDKLSVARGEFPLEQYEDQGSHLAITLTQPLRDRKTWFVFKGHVEILNVPPYQPPNDSTNFAPFPKVRILVPTVFKQRPISAAELPDEEEVSVPPGEFQILDVDRVGNHYKVKLKEPLKAHQEWFIFAAHVQLIDADKLLNASPNPSPSPSPEPVDRGQALKIPGYGTVWTREPIVTNGSFFWGEATKDGTRIPESAEIARNIVKMAQQMQHIREKLGNRSITITSWYRPPAVNRAVGGAPNSTHMRGYGVDFNAEGLSPSAVQRILDPWWEGGLGYGSTFTHLDNRGYRARWNYGN
jgi:hypothetical protein